jgi:hypothetical protein
MNSAATSHAEIEASGHFLGLVDERAACPLRRKIGG